MSNIWSEFGFRANPFSTAPIKANAEGKQLLKGRDKELRLLRMKLTSSDLHTTIEGQNGVGKTSLVGIATFTLYEEFLEDPENKPAFIPVDHIFQISSSENIEAFKEKFLLRMVSFISSLEWLDETRFPEGKLADLRRWSNDPIIKSFSGGFSLSGFGANAGAANSVNSSSAFSGAGLEAALREILNIMFPAGSSGGFVCLLDNMELLDTSLTARKVLEDLRDSVLSFPGIKWVLCGARGIIRSVASTNRLQGKLATPIELSPLADKDVGDVIEARTSILKTRTDAYIPVASNGFKFVYDISNHNLRIALKFCEDYCMWCAFEEKNPQNEEEKNELLKIWLISEAEKNLADTQSITRTGWSVFNVISKKPEGISPTGDYGEFGYDSPQALQPHLRSLEQAALIESTIDDSDRRRKTITLTPRGWLIDYYNKTKQN